MTFLDKETEQLLKECVDNEITYPQVLIDKVKQCVTPLERSHLHSRINILVTEGYLSKIAWADDFPYRGHIETKGLNYFKKKEIYVRSKLRAHPDFSLDAESELCLQRLNSMDTNAPYITINGSIGSASVVQNLINGRYIQVGPKGISFMLSGDFVAVVMILPKGRNYFKNKEEYIEEILAFPQDSASMSTQINVSAGDNSPIQIGNVGSSQNTEYDFGLAQEAIEEILSKIDELGLNQIQKQEVVENLDEAKKLVKEKKKGPLKTILKGVWEVIKDIGCSVASGLILSQFQ